MQAVPGATSTGQVADAPGAPTRPASRWRRRATLPPGVRHVVECERNQRYDLILRDGPAISAELGASPGTRGWVPAVVLAIGVALAGAEDLSSARRYLIEGLEMLPDTPSGEVVGRGERHELALVEILLHRGEFAEASRRVAELSLPERPIEVRFSATRASAHLYAASGDSGRAGFLLNTATNLAQRSSNTLSLALVDADRAMVLASVHRHVEATAALDRVVDRLLAMRTGPHALLGRRSGALSSATVARAAAEAGDVLDAQRLLHAARLATRDDRSRVLDAHLCLGEATLARALTQHHDAERATLEARSGFEATGGAPGAAAAHRLLGLLALDAQRLASAVPLLAHSAHEFNRLGLPGELAASRRLLAEAQRRARLAEI